MVNLLPAFSLLMDESRDRGVMKREGTLIRYYDDLLLCILQLAFWGYERFPRLMLVTCFIST